MNTTHTDSDFQRHTSHPNGIYTAMDTTFFDGQCDSSIEGYRFIPVGESWTHPDGVIFQGEMITPWRPYEILAELQAVYEEEQDKATAEMAALIEEVYNSDMEVIENV